MEKHGHKEEQKTGVSNKICHQLDQCFVLCSELNSGLRKYSGKYVCLG